MTVEVHVIRVVSIPGGLSALVQEVPEGLVVWLLESEWLESDALFLEKDLRAQCAAMRRAPTAA